MRVAWRFTRSEYNVELCVDTVTCQGEILILKAKSMLKPEAVCWRTMIEGWRLMLFHLQEDWNCLAVAITLKTKDHKWREILLLLCVLYLTLICSTTTCLENFLTEGVVKTDCTELRPAMTCHTVLLRCFEAIIICSFSERREMFMALGLYFVYILFCICLLGWSSLTK